MNLNLNWNLVLLQNKLCYKQSESVDIKNACVADYYLLALIGFSILSFTDLATELIPL